MSKNLLTKAEFARVCGVSKPAVAKWATQDRIVVIDGMVDVAASARQLGGMRRDGVPKGLLDFVKGDTAATAVVDPPASRARRAAARITEHRRDDLVARLLALDWKGPYLDNVHDEAVRLRSAAAAVGLELATSERDDDGHWGGYQLRNIATMAREGGICFDAIVAGYGFELEAWDVLRECRDVISHPDDTEEDGDDLIAFDLELLPALAYPFGPNHQPLNSNRSTE